MTTKNKNHDLDAHEKEILEEFEKGNFVSVSDFSCEINQDNKLHFKVNLFVPKITIENHTVII